jgi:hypothetical protein
LYYESPAEEAINCRAGKKKHGDQWSNALDFPELNIAAEL